MTNVWGTVSGTSRAPRFGILVLGGVFGRMFWYILGPEKSTGVFWQSYAFVVGRSLGNDSIAGPYRGVVFYVIRPERQGVLS